MRKKTFDDGYGRHALVYADLFDDLGRPAGRRSRPSFGRTDVLNFDTVNIHPSRQPSGYRPRHDNLTDERVLELIQSELNDYRWSMSTLDAIAAHLRGGGRQVGGR